MTYTAYYESPLGTIALASDGTALTGLGFPYTKVPSHPTEEPNVFSETRRWLDLYFAGRAPDFTPSLVLKGTDFQRRVWQAVSAIPYGLTVSYGDIAGRIGCRSAQAVGGAVGRNPIALIVPCHRVVGADGSLTGYAYGLDRKRCLLQLESRNRFVVTG